MRNPAFLHICETKIVDQLREADQRLCFRYTNSTIPLFPKHLAFRCGCTARFVSDLGGNPEARFSHEALLKFCHCLHVTYDQYMCKQRYWYSGYYKVLNRTLQCKVEPVRVKTDMAANKDMFFYWGSGSAPCWKAMIVLAEKGLWECPNKKIEFSKKEHKGDDVLKLNPRGQVSKENTL